MSNHLHCPICRSIIVLATLALLAVIPPSPCLAEAPKATIHIRNRVLHRLNPDLIGFNLEDLNYQTYGGLDSQLLYGQDFEEQVDVDDLMPVSEGDKKFLYLRRFPDCSVHLVAFGIERGGKQEEFKKLKVDVKNAWVPLEQLSPAIQSEIDKRITGNRQVSYYWRALTEGDARAEFTLNTDKPFNGLQDQKIEFAAGSGEVGVANRGLFRRGIRFEAGKPYEGFMRVRSETPQDLFVSIRDANGKLLAEKTVRVGEARDGLVRGFEKVTFELTPSQSTLGSFAVTLKKPGSVTLGYAFLERGAWGGYAGLPLKKELVEAIRGMNPRVIRYNGGMISIPIVKDTYRWKNMIGPRDLRIPFKGSFNPYASYCFGIFEFLDLANALGVIPIVGIRSDESPQDYLDLLDYANGPADSKWGALRVQNGHPKPYGLTHIEFGNEEGASPGQVERFYAVAEAVWAKDPQVVFVMGDSWVSADDQTKLDKLFEPDQPIGSKIPRAAEVLRFAKAHGKQAQLWWDLHINAVGNYHLGETKLYTPIHASDGVMGALRFRDEVLKLAPDCTFNLALLEENGNGYDMTRALAHVRDHNAIEREGGDKVVAACVANTLQADGLARVWGQGKILFNESKVWPQPPYYVDQMISRNPAPLVLECEYSSRGSHINALAKKTEDDKALILTVANFDGDPIAATVRLDGFDLQGPKTVLVETLGADTLRSENTEKNPMNVAPKIEKRQIEFHHSAATLTFPKFSFTLLRIVLN